MTSRSACASSAAALPGKLDAKHLRHCAGSVVGGRQRYPGRGDRVGHGAISQADDQMSGRGAQAHGDRRRLERVRGVALRNCHIVSSYRKCYHCHGRLISH